MKLRKIIRSGVVVEMFQMGSTMKKSIFDEQTSKALMNWHKNALLKKKEAGEAAAAGTGGTAAAAATTTATATTAATNESMAPNQTTATILTSVDVEGPKPGSQKSPSDKQDFSFK